MILYPDNSYICGSIVPKPTARSEAERRRKCSRILVGTEERQAESANPSGAERNEVALALAAKRRRERRAERMASQKPESFSIGVDFQIL
jgi:hypothetical protein